MGESRFVARVGGADKRKGVSQSFLICSGWRWNPCMVDVDWGQSLKENCFATFLTPTTPTGGGSATVKLARWCDWREWRPGYSSPVSPGLLSHVDSIRKFSVVPQRNLESGWQCWLTYNANVVMPRELVVGLNTIMTNENFIMIWS